MKKLRLVLVSLVLVAGVSFLAMRLGWLAPLGLGAPGQSAPAQPAAAAPSTSPGAQPQTAGGATAQPAEGGVTAATGAAETGVAQGAQPSETAVGGGLPAAPIPPAKFDGNVALIDFGGMVERTSDNYGGSVNNHAIIDGDPSTAWRSVSNHPGAGEVVLSFFAREPVWIDRVTIRSTESRGFPRDIELWVSTAATPDGPFTRVAATALPGSHEATVPLAPVEARFLKFRMLKSQENEELFYVSELEVHEAERTGYVPLLTRHPELARPGGPVTLPGGTPVASTMLPPCKPSPESVQAPPASAHPRSSKVLVVSRGADAYGIKRILEYKEIGRLDDGLSEADVTYLSRLSVMPADPVAARPAMLAPAVGVDTVVLAQLCGDQITSVSAAFKQALMTWVAAGHKLIIQDSDDCNNPGPDYSFIPYGFKTDNPGAQGAQGSDLRFIETNTMLHNRPGQPGYLDAQSWVGDVPPYRNELGDANTLVAWDANWCGQMAVRNVNNVFGFVVTYAHYGRGLIIYEGYDNDQAREPGYDTVMTRELLQGFDPDNLPCGARLGDFVLSTDSWLLYRAALPGRAYTYPLTLLSNQGYKGTVNLSASSAPSVPGLQARLEPASVALGAEGQSTLTLTLPGGAAPPPVAVEIKGTDAAGRTNTLCLQLGPAKSGELAIVSALSPPTKTRKNLEIILDASGSMKTLMGKKSRWDTALATLQAVLAKLPADFNVGLRIYGHREPSTSPKTCTDSELLVPIQKLDRAGILNAAKAFKPKGETPLVYSALQAPADLKAVGGGTVILITDGQESCKGDPVKAAAELKASGLDIRLNIVGFAVTDPRVQKDLAGFSQGTNGRFYAAQSGQALGDALLIAAIEKFPYTVFDEAGKQVTAGEAGGPPEELAAGDYKVVVKAGAKEIVAPRVHITLGETTMLRILLKGDQLVLE
jgi:hypothetical protein